MTGPRHIDDIIPGVLDAIRARSERSPSVTEHLPLAQQIRESLSFRRGTPFTVRHMAWQLDRHETPVAVALHDLCAAGDAERLGEDTFRKAPPAEPVQEAA